MKIAIATTQIPFVRGGAETLVEMFCRELRLRGHEAQIFRVPLCEFPPAAVMEGVLGAKLLEIPGADLVVAMKFPAYLIRHPNKRYWIIHQLRQAYDLYGTDYGYRDAPRLKRAVYDEDVREFTGAGTPVYTISDVVTQRLERYNGIRAQTLYCPIQHPEQYVCGDQGDYIFYPSRVNTLKRQTLLVEAMRWVKTPVRLLLAGKGDSEECSGEIWRRVRKYALEEKVRFVDRFITEEEKARWYADCLGVGFVPFEEDFGYITPEAFASGKPVITCTDAGGPLYLVEDGMTGLVAEPRPEQLAAAMDRLFERRDEALRMGRNAREKFDRLGMNWDHVIGTLLAPGPQEEERL